MRPPRFLTARLWRLLVMAAALYCESALACPQVPADARFTVVRCDDQPAPTPWSQLLRILFGLDARATRPLRVAVVAGIDRYPQMAKEPTLPPAGKDIENLIDLFANFLAYDVVIVSKNEAVEPTQFVRLFSEYLPSILQNRFGSQVVFAYSGHGGFWTNESYILTQRAERLIIDSQKSADDAISMTDLRSMLRPTIIASHQFLALLNSCEGGAFLRDRLRFGQPSFKDEAAVAATAGREQDIVYAGPKGMGSVFFETIISILRTNKPPVWMSASGQNQPPQGNPPDQPAATPDGMITLTDLMSQVRGLVNRYENYRVLPQWGPILDSRRESDFVFFVDAPKVKEALKRTHFKSARAVFGVNEVPTPPAWPLTNLFSIEEAQSLAKEGDYEVLGMKAGRRSQICFIESTGVAYGNSLLEKNQFRMWQMRLFGTGKQTKLRYIPFQDALPNTAAGFWYLVDADALSTLRPATGIEFVVDRATNDNSMRVKIDKPTERIQEGIGIELKYRNGNLFDEISNGRWISVTGFERSQPLPLTPTLVEMNPKTLAFLNSRISGSIAIAKILGVQEDFVKRTAAMKDLVRYDTEPSSQNVSDIAKRGEFKQDNPFTSRHENAGYQALPYDQQLLIQRLSEKDWLAILSAYDVEREIFGEQISLFGFTRAFAKLREACAPNNPSHFPPLPKRT
ncbi:hypothetical protein ACVWZV_003176 [Bradyrhizobium sp. GM5.1]